MATHMNEYFNPYSPVQPEHILTGAGLTAVHAMLALSIGDPGDGILVSRPMYGRFELDFGNEAGMRIVYADMDGVDPFASEVVERYQVAFNLSAKRGVNIKAIMIVNPHNPLGIGFLPPYMFKLTRTIGRCYPESTLKRVMAFCQRNSIHLISDEVYGLSVNDTDSVNAPLFTSALSISPENLIDVEKLHILYGLSKVCLHYLSPRRSSITHLGLCSSWSPSWLHCHPKHLSKESNAIKHAIP